jgi:CRISPR-associated endoribonuclease Cas6
VPYSLVIHATPATGSLAPQDLQGQKGLALFLDHLIRERDAEAAADLHASHRAKPFTTAILTPTDADLFQGGRAQRRYNGDVRLRVTLLRDDLYALCMRAFLDGAGSGATPLRLGQTPLVVSKVTVTRESGEAWSGHASFDELLAGADPAAQSWAVRFCTATAFRAGDADCPLPLPRLVFQSWLESWDQHAPLGFFPDRESRRAFLQDVVEQRVSVAYDRLSMVRQALFFDGHRTAEQGFVGICRFRASARLGPSHRRILSALAGYAFYCGTGRKTTMGMGLTRRLDSQQGVEDARA